MIFIPLYKKAALRGGLDDLFVSLIQNQAAAFETCLGGC